MMNQATKATVLAIMKKRATWKPYEVVFELQKKDIFISESTLTRQYRRWSEVIALEPVDRKVSRAWTYALVQPFKGEIVELKDNAILQTKVSYDLNRTAIYQQR